MRLEFIFARETFAVFCKYELNINRPSVQGEKKINITRRVEGGGEWRGKSARKNWKCYLISLYFHCMCLRISEDYKNEINGSTLKNEIKVKILSWEM